MYKTIISKVADELNLPYNIVDKTYKAYWLFIKNSIESLPLKEDIDYNTFLKLNTNFNISYLGKLNCTYDRMVGVKKRFKYIKDECL